MNRKCTKSQLALFPEEFPSWDSLPLERQQQLQEILSLLFEQSLQLEVRSTDDPHDQSTETSHA